MLRSQIQKKLQKNSKLLKYIGLAVSDISPSEDIQKENSFYFFHNEDKLFIPASLSKIVTASALFHYFKPSHQFETFFVSEKRPDEEGNLKSNLYIKGGGDPSFVSESLWNLVNNLKRSGLKNIEGDLILDDSLFKNFSKKEFSSDRSYNSLISALSFNWNTVNVYIRPGRKLHHPAQIFIDPENGGYIQVKNQTRTKGRIRSVRVRRKPGPQGDIIQVTGSLPLNTKEYVVYKNVTRPTFWTGGNVQEFLKRRGIHIKGQMLKGESPSSAHILASYKGRNLFRLVQDMMKFSSNFLADMLAVQLSLLKGEKRGSLEKGVHWIRLYMEQNGIKDYTFESPSGLSRKNKLKAKGILRILLKDASSPYSYEKMTSYALAGEQGTLKGRFKNLKKNVVIRAKTGLLSGVLGISGYIRSSSGRLRAFVFIYNGRKGSLQNQAQKLFDDLAVLIGGY